MDLLSLSPLQASLLLFRQASGEWTQTVVCKATFSLSPGVARLAPEQEAPNEDDNHWNDDPTRSLYAPSDLAPFKPRADVLLVGNAFAPGGTPVRSLIARLTTAGVDKAIEVIGDRAARDGKVQEPAWFTSMPLRYERAAGGPETWNPVGVSPLARPDANGIIRLPNLAPAVMGPRDPGAPILPAGFGPIAPSWPVRASKLGHHAKVFADPGWRQRPLPEGIDPGYWNAAPRDQQPQEIRDDEPITLENLHRGHARLVTVLPGLHPRVFAEKAGGPRREIKMTCDTLWIDTDRSICTLTWRGQVALASPDEQGRIAVAMEERNQRLSTADIDRLVAVARSRGGAPARDPAPAPSGGAPPSYDETYRLSSSQQRSLPTGPAWLAPPKSERNAPAPPLRPPPPPPPLLPVPAAVDRVEPAAAESPWAADVRAGIVPSAPRPVVEAPAPPMAIPKAVVPLPPAADAMGAASERALSPEVVELVWLDPKFSLKIRKAPAWKKLLGEAKPRTSEDDADLETSTERKEAKERRDVAWILKTGDAAGSQELDDVLDRAMDDGTFVPPLALLAGDFDLPFDELEALKASIAVAASFAPADKQLKEALEKIREASDAPLVDRAAAEKLTARLGEVFGQSQRSLPEGYLASQAARLLLEERRYQKRTLLGQAWIRGLLTLPGATAPVPAYLPDSLAQELPMFQRFRARLIAEARPALDQYETQPIALRVVALARLVAPPRRRKSR